MNIHHNSVNDDNANQCNNINNKIIQYHNSVDKNIYTYTCTYTYLYKYVYMYINNDMNQYHSSIMKDPDPTTVNDHNMHINHNSVNDNNTNQYSNINNKIVS
jgi:hypothetical protein